MKTSSLFVVAGAGLLLIGCAGTPEARTDLLQNPLYARYYYQDQADMMVNYSIQNDPMLKDAKKKEVVDAVRIRATDLAKEASNKVNAARRGGFMSDFDYATGQAMVADGMVHFGQDFNTLPGPDVSVYASMLLDPRDGSGTLLFPDDSATKIGRLQSPYGAQSYAMPEDKKNEPFRTLILWDEKLERMLGFAQLSQ